VSDKFFKDRQGAAVLKHAILEKYLPAFVGKVGSSAPDGQVFYLDGFAGAGMYDDGTPGSPLLAARTAEFLSERNLRRLECIYVEQDRSNFDRLVAALTGATHVHHTYCDKIANVIDDVLARCDGAPLFAFLDPFGLLGMPFEEVVQRILVRHAEQRGQRVVTEVLLNFSLVALHRVGGQLTGRPQSAASQKARATMIEGMDGSLGGSWWQELWLERGPERDIRIIEEYRARLVKAAPEDYGSWTVPVSDHPRSAPVYVLILLSAHREGFKTFNDALSSATEAFEKHCSRGDELPFDRDAELSDTIRGNLERLLAEGGSISVDQRFLDVFGDALGRAREKHLRRAIKELHKDGKTQSTGKGKLYNSWIEPPKTRQ